MLPSADSPAAAEAFATFVRNDAARAIFGRFGL
jgi:hypothetical protein